MPLSEYHDRIVRYYKDSEDAYKDAWDLNRSMAIHYGYWDEKVQSFPASLSRMNEVMMEAAGIQQGNFVLDAGCGVGGSSIQLARKLRCHVTGVTLSDRQAQQARENVHREKLEALINIQVLDYADTGLPSASFDVVWGCESICYADNKELFIREAYRLLKPGGRLVVADGFVTDFANNDHIYIRRWLEGWQVNYLESPKRFEGFMKDAGFLNTIYKNISKYARHSSKRLYRFYYLANLYLAWKKMTFSNHATDFQKKNIRACKYQYKAAKKGLWQYGLITGKKP